MHWGPLLFVIGIALGTAQARAEEWPLQRQTGLSRQNGKLTMSLGLQDLFTERDVDRLLSGFTTRVLIRAVVMRVHDDEIVAEAMRVAEVVYDLWDEKLRVRLSYGRPPQFQIHEVNDPRAAMQLATTLVAFPVADLNRLTPGLAYRIRVRADLNPISEELLQNLRRWLSTPTVRGRSGENFFGSLLRVFVNPRIEDSERILQCSSQTFVEPTGSP
jgi:hypothetical protein